MKIVFTEIKEKWQKDLITEKLAKHEVKIYSKALQDLPIEEIKDAEILCVFIYSKADAEMLKKFPKLKMVAANSTGYNHIDLEYCKANKIQVCNVPHYGENTVAEFTFALLLAISRKIIDSVERVRSGSFEFDGLRGFDLVGKTIGVIGYGNIGQKFAKMCAGFEMNVIIFDVNAKKLKREARKIKAKFVSLEELYERSDVVSLHIPLIESTKHIINKESISKMKKGVIILNTSRGDLIDSTALLDALQSKKVGFAGLDVLEGECMIKDELELLHEETKKACDLQILLEDHKLIHDKRVFVTPHNAFNTQDALSRIMNTSLYNIDKFLRKKKLENKV